MYGYGRYWYWFILFFSALRIIPDEHRPAVIAQLMYDKSKNKGNNV